MHLEIEIEIEIEIEMHKRRGMHSSVVSRKSCTSACTRATECVRMHTEESVHVCARKRMRMCAQQRECVLCTRKRMCVYAHERECVL